MDEAHHRVEGSAHALERPGQAVLAGIVLLGIAAVGFVAIASDADARGVGTATAVRLLAMSGALGAGAMGLTSFRLLRRQRAATTPQDPSDRRSLTAWGAMVGFGAAAVLLALTGSVAIVLFGLLFGVVAALGLIAAGRGLAALVKPGR